MTTIYTTKEMRPRSPFEYYPTPAPLIDAAYAYLKNYLVSLNYPMRKGKLWICDAGAGRGEWGPAIKKHFPRSTLVGIEIVNKPSRKNAPFYDHWIPENFMEPFADRVSIRSDLYYIVSGNPPYADVWEASMKQAKRDAKKTGTKFVRPARPESAGPIAGAEEFVDRGLSLVGPGGFVYYLLRGAFAESESRYQTIFKLRRPVRIVQCVQRPSFTGDGKTDGTSYALFLFRKGHHDQTIFDWLSWNNR